ncbi:MAG TPA: prolyl-tRNA synthetase associated domain-containing protein [Candidatus Paceibacterota bacterium]|jgi:Ala-tRNA(Pro) deacylase|nr:aminoacyl-tRNA deacylase [Parcubacteria group bacterium]MDP6119546.1 prolyl-tRNA synthetase associated domain-containing protein [Candidatus Paceibacterota bacterium]HJN63008.1 prolyl-tRNA synthetase associated domain-containing protein [Candidatus Paceibacterota bacterium]|tara:strand:- start:536 stop:1009 length:474 start_codon:yes stop_codon:yes gene_type:complete
MNIYQTLDSLGIKHKVYEHRPVFTVEESLKFKDEIPGERNKNLFAKGERTGKYYLISIRGDKKLDNKSFKKEFSERVRFCNSEDLMKYLGLKPGSVSPFGLINDKEKEVVVIVDTDLLKNEKIHFHPDRNSATMEISSEDFKKYLERIGNKIIYKKL